MIIVESFNTLHSTLQPEFHDDDAWVLESNDCLVYSTYPLPSTGLGTTKEYNICQLKWNKLSKNFSPECIFSESWYVISYPQTLHLSPNYWRNSFCSISRNIRFSLCCETHGGLVSSSPIQTATSCSTGNSQSLGSVGS